MPEAIMALATVNPPMLLTIPSELKLRIYVSTTRHDHPTRPTAF